jgi:hypothetical protein
MIVVGPSSRTRVPHGATTTRVQAITSMSGRLPRSSCHTRSSVSRACVSDHSRVAYSRRSSGLSTGTAPRSLGRSRWPVHASRGHLGGRERGGDHCWRVAADRRSSAPPAARSTSTASKTGDSSSRDTGPPSTTPRAAVRRPLRARSAPRATQLLINVEPLQRVPRFDLIVDIGANGRSPGRAGRRTCP